ncbi:MAG: hypothetical protein COB26_09120, partial [Piscirickettsiaceae bacterium]
ALTLVTGFTFFMKIESKHQSSCSIRPLVAAKGGPQFTRFSEVFNHTKSSSRSLPLTGTRQRRAPLSKTLGSELKLHAQL